MSGPPNGLVIHTFNVVLGQVLVGPFVVFYWQGTWGIQDYYFFPSNKEYSAWLSFAIGIIGTFLAGFTQSFWTEVLLGSNAYAFAVVTRIYTAVAAFSIVCYWRGVWSVLDVYTGTGLPSAATCAAAGVFVLVVMKTFCNLVTPPFVIFMDTDREGYFKANTWFNTKPSISWKFAGDQLFTVVMVTAVVVITWRGLWTLLDLYLYPDDQLLTCLWSLVIYMCSLVLVLVFQYPVSCLLRRIDSSLGRLIIEDCFGLVKAIGSITYWRGNWDLLKYFFMTDYIEKEVWLTHCVGTLGLCVTLAFTSIPGRGGDLDCRQPDGRGAYLDIPILRGYKKTCRRRKFSTQVSTLVIEEMKEQIQPNIYHIS